MEYQFTPEEIQQIRDAIEWAMKHPVKDVKTISEVLEGANH